MFKVFTILIYKKSMLTFKPQFPQITRSCDNVFGNISWFNPVEYNHFGGSAGGESSARIARYDGEDKESLALCMLKRKCVHLIKSKESLKLATRQAEAVNQRTDNTMTK